ncbi:hypothetical protein K3727_21485 (plasmid) [Rhodobacteraceae bacterium M382]|nr:hypothetical protein K3727_21485 [Rhodobacteraceae bacterium M382]
MDLSGMKFALRRFLGLCLAIGALWISAACLPNSSQARNTTTAGADPGDGCRQMMATGGTDIRETYVICPLARGPGVLERSDLRAAYDRLPAGNSLNVAEHFLRADQRWPYVDVRGPGANTSPNMPNPPRAAYLMHAADPAFDGPVLFIAPAQVEHSLGPAASGQTPADVWTVTAGPYAPTVYGRIRTAGGDVTDFVAHPTEAGTEVFGEAARIELSQLISRHFGGA